MQSSSLDRAVGSGARTVAQNTETAETYCLHCPDVVDVKVDGRPDWSGKRAVGPDGRIDLHAGDRVRIEGRTPSDSIRLVAAEAEVKPYQVQVQVAEFNSQQIYLFGPGVGVQRAAPYHGPETVVEFLQRTGAVTAGAAPDNIYVVRPRIAEGQQPEVFPVQLRPILSKKDQQSNIRLQPYDQVYIGETRKSSIARCIAPCLRPLYDLVCGLHGPAPDAEQKEARTASNQLPATEFHAPEN
jgi:protein involved in polysaccharide export with SLBB domain